MFRERDLKRAIWTSIVLLMFLIPSVSLAQIPEEAEIHNRLGNEYCDSGEFKKAVMEYEQALKIYPQYVDAYYNIAVTYYNDLKDYQEAANYFQKFLEFESDTPDAKDIKKWLTEIEKKHGIKPKSLPPEKKAEPVKEVVTPAPPPETVEPVKEVAKPSPPPEELKKATLTPPTPPPSAVPEPPTKAIATPPPIPLTPPSPPVPGVPLPQKQQEKPKMAAREDKEKEEIYKRALAYKNRGNLYSKQGKHQMAVREYLKAVELRPNYTDALYNLSKTYDFNLNDKENAIKHYEAFLQYEPSNSRDARQVQTWLTKAKMDLASSKKAPPKVITAVPEVQEPKVPTVSAKYESKPFTKGLLEKPIEVASVSPEPSVPVVPKVIAPPVPVAIPAPGASRPSLAPAVDSAMLKSYTPKELKSIQYSIMLRAEMRNELMDIFRSKNASEPDKLAQLFLTKLKQETLPSGDEIANIEVPGSLLANIEKVNILSYTDRITLNNEKGSLLRSPQTPESKERLREINQILEDGYEIKL
ncbi:MAG: tetratricopeptide repeat protein [bacterium]